MEAIGGSSIFTSAKSARWYKLAIGTQNRKDKHCFSILETCSKIQDQKEGTCSVHIKSRSCCQQLGCSRRQHMQCAFIIAEIFALNEMSALNSQKAQHYDQNYEGNWRQEWRQLGAVVFSLPRRIQYHILTFVVTTKHYNTPGGNTYSMHSS